MSSDLSSQLMASHTAGTQHSVQTAILKKSQEMELDLAITVTKAVQTPPPAGQGAKIDKLA
jgi:hypothetical protein